MHRTRTWTGLAIIVVGLIWVGQGSGLLRGSSFMVGDPMWAVFGVVAIVFGLGVITFGLRGRA